MCIASAVHCLEAHILERMQKVAGTHPSWKQPHLLIEPLTAAFQYIHQKLLVLISAFQCDLHSPSNF